jgi:hypothetical protein
MTCRIADFIPASLILPQVAPCGSILMPSWLYTARGVVNVGLSAGNINPRAEFLRVTATLLGMLARSAPWWSTR